MTSPHHDPGPSLPAPALDQTERVILQAAEEEGGLGGSGDVIVVGDATGELTAAALAATTPHPDATVWSWSSSRAGSEELAARFGRDVAAGRLRVPRDPEPEPLEVFAAAADAPLVLLRLPRALAELDDHARRLAALAGATGRAELALIAGGRVKHMTRSQNEILAGAFGAVRASRGVGKSRALVATRPRPGIEPAPAATGTAHLTLLGRPRELTLHGIGGVFGGATADAGSLLLLGALDEHLAATPRDGAGLSALDLGCGNGLLTAYLAAALPAGRVLGSDDDAQAVASTRATLAANGLEREEVRVSWDHSVSREQDASVDLVVLNPPFHDGAAIDATLVQGLLDASARVLRPGGELWFVHNSHLRHRTEAERRVGPTRQAARDRRFTVLRARKPGPPADRG